MTPTTGVVVDAATRRHAASVLAVFDRSQLRQARELRSMTQAELARRSNKAFSAAAVSFWESGQNKPAPETLALVARLLEVPIEFFAVDARDSRSVVGTFFRSLRSTPVGERRKARARVQLAHRLLAVLEEYADLPELSVPSIRLRPEATASEIDEVAGELRHALGVPPGPVRHVVNLLERNGVAVIRLGDVHLKIDAFSVPFPERPIIALGNEKQDKARSRLDASHELIHLACHRPEEEATVRLERQATRAGAAFLMPRDELLADLEAERITWSRLAELKVKWLTSIQAIVARARSIGFLDDAEYLQMAKAMSARGWRKPNAEPVPLGAPEQPALLAGAAAASGLDLRELAALAGLPAQDVVELVEAVKDRRPPVRL